jgi:hypothetical protein
MVMALVTEPLNYSYQEIYHRNIGVSVDNRILELYQEINLSQKYMYVSSYVKKKRPHKKSITRIKAKKKIIKNIHISVRVLFRFCTKIVFVPLHKLFLGRNKVVVNGKVFTKTISHLSLPQNENSVEWMIMFTAIFVLL